MARGNILDDKARARIAEAIRQAEKTTAGEVYCVLARASDDYFFPAAFFVALSILVVSLPAAFLLHYWWIAVTPAWFVAAQLGAFGAALLVLKLLPGLRIHLVPRGLRYRRAHDHALRQFLAHNIHLTQDRTGALIFVSLSERYAEVVADAGINACVPQERWNQAVEKLTRNAAAGDLAQGFIEAIALVGAELAAHFPPDASNPDEIDNHLAEI
ncbi:TPM domain-containing protein [Chelativorans sp. AA-79]|uniref:TPM domain-containing protein n=1 Tax=Chelativorans sp. AA-79 TaxID=3028735 RepID=UPI0023F869CE|nr:TPM domain-containing protein [Chelativorans sp. AA-79]WEX09927.1 TPM domain-containing protein [Chelativorans sp. AA-79]